MPPLSGKLSFPLPHSGQELVAPVVLGYEETLLALFSLFLIDLLFTCLGLNPLLGYRLDRQSLWF